MLHGVTFWFDTSCTASMLPVTATHAARLFCHPITATRDGAAPTSPWPHALALRPGATICVVEIAVYLALGARWEALAAPGGWRPIATLSAAMLVPVVWCRRIVDFEC